MSPAARWAKAARQRLLAALGGRCVGCGTRDRLEIDHVDGRTWEPRKLSSSARVCRYWREYHAGVRLRVLCQSCNGRDGAYRYWIGLDYWELMRVYGGAKGLRAAEDWYRDTHRDDPPPRTRRSAEAMGATS